ncbi:MAG: T9SS type A sorting domain-containing protein [Bacteroidota bacterium]|jgi:hypothetical protein|nr:T9SS type A sorting domain-containing protein [Saprospiraceae bacterium]
MRIFSLLLLLPGFLSSQVLPDQVWLAGTHDIPGQPGYENVIIRFQSGQVLTETTDLRMNFESTVAVMPDSLGNILFYTNGCYVANVQGDTMANGAGLNPGEMADWTCPTSGYAAPLGAMALQLPGNSHLYYLFHMGVRYNPEKKLTYGPFYYSIIDMEMDGGNGAVISSNNILSDGHLEPFTAVRHGNGRDWWLVFPEYGTNKYYRVLFSASGVQQIDTQEIGEALSCRYIGSSAFSPNGVRYARQQHCGVVVMDFDRCSGAFSNARFIGMPFRAILGGGIAFSGDGNKLLVNTQLSIQEADLTLPNPVLDTIVPSLDIAGASLLLMQYAPNGKIYMNNLGRTKAYHVINTPDDPDIGFEQRGLSLPVYAIRSLPNYPNYRLYDLPGSICDTLGIDEPIVSAKDSNPLLEISVFPNPFLDKITVTLNSDLPNTFFSLYDQTGRLVLSANLVDETTKLTGIKLPVGVYFSEVKEGESGRKVRGKLIKAGN